MTACPAKNHEIGFANSIVKAESIIMELPNWVIVLLLPFWFVLVLSWLYRSRSRKRRTVLEMKNGRQQQANRKERGGQELPQNEAKQNMLEIGNRVELSGGYDMTPKWLGGKDFYLGTVIAFLPRDVNETPYAIVRSDENITFDGFTGNIIVLSLRYKGAQWSIYETVHLYLLDSPPQNGEFHKKGNGRWMESHASYKVIA